LLSQLFASQTKLLPVGPTPSGVLPLAKINNKHHDTRPKNHKNQIIAPGNG
jgi:hypothetical protein